MKVARLYGFDDIRIEDMPVPEVGPREALLKTVASGVCSGDAMPWYVERKAPFVLGHEPAGVIMEVGSEVSSIKAGDRVFVHHHAPCFGCRNCRRGDHVQCPTWKGTSIVPGGISEYILIPETNLENDTLALPGHLSFEDGTLVEPLACVIKALKRARIRKGDTALVIGLGAMGMLNVLSLRRYGAEKVIGADMVPYRLRKAEELGADGVIDASRQDTARALAELTDGQMADIVIAGPNSVEALVTGIKCAGPGGTVVMFTPVKPEETLTLNPNELYFRDVSMVTSYSCGPADTADALALIDGGTVRAEMVVTHRFPIEEAAMAYRVTAEAGDSLKCMIVF